MVVAVFEWFWESLDDYGKFSARHPEAPDPFKLDRYE